MRFGVIRSLAFIGSAALIGICLSPSARAQFGTGTDIYWAQTNGGSTATANSGSSSDPSGFSVDGLWNDTLSTGYASPNNVSPGSYPSINWSTNATGAGASGFTPAPGPYPSGSPNPYDPGYIPGSPGHTGVDVVFDAGDGNNSPSAIQVNYSPTVQGLYITNIGTVTEIRTDTATDPQTITIGSDGLNIEPTAASSPKANSGNNILFGNTGAPLTIAITGTQTWANLTGTTSASNPQSLVMSGPIMLAPGVNTPVTLTLSAPGDVAPTFAANNHLNGTITDNTSTGGVLAFDVTSGQWTFGAGGTPPAPSTFSGGVTIEAGAQAKDLYATGMGTGAITIKSGGTLYANSNATAVTNTTYANPIILAGVGTAGTGINGFTTVGAIESMNSGGGSSMITETLSGGLTLNGSALIEALDDPIIINTGPVNLGANTLTLAAGGPVKNGSNTNTLQMSISSSIVDGNLGGGVIVNTVAGTLAGGGTITLSGNNSYTGPTTVTKGTLALSTSGNNNISTSPTVTVSSVGVLDVTQVSGSGGFQLASGQTLTGEGTVTGSLAVMAASHLDPGGPAGTIGTLHVGATTFQPSAVLDYEFSTTPTNDFLAAGGLAINGGGVNLYQAGNPTAAFDTPGTYDLMSYTGTIGGTGVGALSVLNPQPGFTYTFGLDASHSNDVDLTIAPAPVPEPGSLALLGIAGLGLAGWCVGRRKLGLAS